MFNPNLYLKTLKPQIQHPKFHLSLYYIHHKPTPRNPSLHNPAIEFVQNEAKEFQSSKTQFSSAQKEEPFLPQKQRGAISGVQITHPWREWVDLMKKLLKDGYFDGIGNPFANNGELSSKEANYIRTACLNYARDQYQLIRYLSREDILVLAGSGCPSTDRKVVNSGKRLRAHVGIEEGNVCSSCILRGDCDRAYVKAREDEGGRTVDVMRFLLTYGLDPIVGSVENKPCLNKRVKECVRTLLKEMVDISVVGNGSEPPNATISECNSSTKENEIPQERVRSNTPMKQGDWICTKCNFHNFARNFKCLCCDNLSEERLKKIAEEQENLPLKKGDWICDKCKFLNFAKNTRCLMCKEKPPKRQLNPGEWECESCNYINFRRNMVCLKCDHRRAIALNTTDISAPEPANNNVNHETQSWFMQEKQSRYNCANNSLEFVENDSQCHSSLGSMDFPVLGGKSELSRDLQKQAIWKMEMANKSRTRGRTRENTGKCGNSISQKKREYLAFGDDDDEMADWFEGGKT